MMSDKVCIYHITHIENLASIVRDACLWSDRRIAAKGSSRVIIGLDHIKRRRMEELPVRCHSGTKVGDYVPFYFCPRSPMLYMIHSRNTALEFAGGQERVVHLVSTVATAIRVAGDRPWAFTDDNAGARYTRFCANLDQLPTFIHWRAVRTRRWSGPGVDPSIKSKKMAEFLVYERFPWEGIDEIGVLSDAVAEEARQTIAPASHRPRVQIRPSWYY